MARRLHLRLISTITGRELCCSGSCPACYPRDAYDPRHMVTTEDGEVNPTAYATGPKPKPPGKKRGR